MSRKAAAVGLVYLIYTTLSTEIDNMLQPPRSMDEVEFTAEKFQKIQAQGPAKSKYFNQGVQGMGYIHDPDDVLASGGRDNAQIPIVTVAPHVLMTSDCGYLAGVGEKIKGDNHRLG